MSCKSIHICHDDAFHMFLKKRYKGEQEAYYIQTYVFHHEDKYLFFLHILDSPPKRTNKQIVNGTQTGASHTRMYATNLPI